MLLLPLPLLLTTILRIFTFHGKVVSLLLWFNSSSFETGAMPNPTKSQIKPFVVDGRGDSFQSYLLLNHGRSILGIFTLTAHNRTAWFSEFSTFGQVTLDTGVFIRSSDMQSLKIRGPFGTVAVWTIKKFFPLLIRPQGSQGYKKITFFFTNETVFPLR